MNQIEIGKFIANQRKEIGLTQAQLAEQLAITNRAVSKWETGKSMPDVSIMLQLCEILGITVNDLLSGKKLNTQEEKIENEKHILSMLLAKKELKRVRMCAGVLIFVGLTLSTSFTSIMAETLFEKTLTFTIGAVAWGYGVWLNLKIANTLKDM